MQLYFVEALRKMFGAQTKLAVSLRPTVQSSLQITVTRRTLSSCKQFRYRPGTGSGEHGIEEVSTIVTNSCTIVHEFV